TAPYQGAMPEYIRGVWAASAVLPAATPVMIGEFDAAIVTARMNSGRGPVDVTLAAIRVDPSHIYRFAFLGPPGQSEARALIIKQTLQSFRTISAAEAAALKPLRVRVIAVRPGDTVNTLANRMQFDRMKLERFLLLNGLVRNQPLKSGRLVKIITD
ncbi:MAG: M48 family metalloprotease, partial [Candidatus Binataceae bacterium]